MTNNKLPPYFEKYFEQKFGEVNDRLLEMQNCMQRYEVRVSTLEVWKANIMGRIAVISFALVLVVDLIVNWFRKKFDL